jgi:hypothetical protein
MILDDIWRDVRLALAQKLGAILPVVGGSEWWRWYVVEQMSEAQRVQHADVKPNDMLGLDMAALLRVCYRNWSELAAKGFLPKRQSHLAARLIDTRNRWAHESARGPRIIDLRADFDAIHRFLIAMEADGALIDHVARYRWALNEAASPPAIDARPTNLAATNSTVVAQSIDKEAQEGSAAGGIIEGLSSTITDVSGTVIPASEFRNLGELLKRQSGEYSELLKRRRRLRRGLVGLQTEDGTKKAILLDTFLVGGETLAAYLDSGTVSDDVLQAYELAYPRVAASETLAEQIESLDANAIQGFASGIKGKLFELKYADYLNDGNLPEGFEARISPDPTNPGWDIEIVGPDDQLSEVIQLKATDSVGYVKDALERYPDIDVVTTHEVFGSLVMEGLAENVADSGITQDSLEKIIEGSFDSAAPSIDFVPSPISLALIAFSVYSRDDLSRYAKFREAAQRGAKTYLAYLAGNSLTVMTGTWWLGLLGGMGARVLIEAGRLRNARFVQLHNMVNGNTKVLERLRAANERLSGRLRSSLPLFPAGNSREA